MFISGRTMVTLTWPDFAPHLEQSNGGKERRKDLAVGGATLATPVVTAVSRPTKNLERIKLLLERIELLSGDSESSH